MVSRLAKASSKFQKCSKLLIIHVKKFHVFNFRCLAESRNFFTIETFANYGMNKYTVFYRLIAEATITFSKTNCAATKRGRLLYEGGY